MSEEEKHRQITFLQRTTEWLVYFIIFTLIIGILSIFYVFNFIQSMDLMISNQTEAKILIESCSLNDIDLLTVPENYCLDGTYFLVMIVKIFKENTNSALI
ncbi:MAG: hypothetical protein CTY34_03265 [Methylobacter sp.]|nr:MAG: hypothetical protein CTY34_03265 [Methylobacter sp.]PPD17340.1 MAG: hypothetical protein CTY24_15100 [Methylobacter sp.]